MYQKYNQTAGKSRTNYDFDSACDDRSAMVTTSLPTSDPSVTFDARHNIRMHAQPEFLKTRERRKTAAHAPKSTMPVKLFPGCPT